MPSLERTKNQEFELTSYQNPLYIIKEGHTGERRGPKPWQYAHWKSKGCNDSSEKERLVH